MSILRAFLGGGIVAVACGVASGACLSPTQVTLHLTTTVPCTSRVQTQVFVRASALTEVDPPVAETDRCEPSEPRIGTLVVTPGGARDSSFRVEVVTGVGVSASSCRATGYARCIVARRLVGFREHVPADLPIQLHDRCIGVPCGADQTCDVGRCVAVSECGESGCPGERADAGTVATDAGDAGADAAVADAGPEFPVLAPDCTGTVETVLEGQAIIGQLAIDGADFVYANAPSAAAAEIRRAPRVGGKPTTVRAVPGLTAIAVAPDALAFAADSPNGSQITRILQGVEVNYSALAGRTTSSLAFAGTTVVGFVSGATSGSTNAFAATNAIEVLSAGLPGPVPELLVDNASDFYGVSGGQTLVHHRVNGGGLVLASYAPFQPSKGDIALSGQNVFIASEHNGAQGIHVLAQVDIQPAYAGAPWLAGVVPRSLAADAAFVYYLHGTTLFRAQYSGFAIPQALAGASPTADRLALDGACAYWLEDGGTRIRRVKK